MGKKVVFTWGRYNPPTVGHKLVMEAGAKAAKAQGADYIILASKTEAPANKNPLSFKDKIKFLKLSFPKYKRYINSDPKLNTLIRVMQFLDKSYDEATIVVGSDRKDDFLKLLNRYNGQDYNFDKIDVALSGDRDPDAEDASGMSASKMRQAAVDGDYEAFKTGSPMRNPKALYDAVRKGMGVAEAVEEYMNVLHEDINSGRFNRLLRLGLVSPKNYPVTKRAFSDFKVAAPQPDLRNHIFTVTNRVIEMILADELVYNRFIQMVIRKNLIDESQRDSLIKKANKSGISYFKLLEVYFRGLFSLDNESIQHQYAFNRVNSFISGGKSQQDLDSDLWDQHLEETTIVGGNGMKSLKSILSETGGAGEWGTKKLSDKYIETVPGQPDNSKDIKSMRVYEKAPVGKAAEAFIKDNKKKFKERYGDRWESVLYATAWKLYGKKEEVELTEGAYRYAIEVGEYIVASHNMKEFHLYKGDDYGYDQFVEKFSTFDEALRRAYHEQNVPFRGYKHIKIRGFNPK